jgi:succinoglycan biosynthesis protein ExoA
MSSLNADGARMTRPSTSGKGRSGWREGDPSDHEDLVTVAVPARNEEAFIASCLDSILLQDHRNVQVIVVDGASQDGTPAILAGYANADSRVTIVQNPQETISRSLNLALAEARGRWFVRVDAHSTIDPTYVALATGHLRTGAWGGVGGRKDAVGLTPSGRAIAVALGSRFGVGDSTYHHGTVARTVDHIPFGAYPTELLRQLGGWNEQLLANEDFELDQRIRETGHELLFDPAIRISWYSRQTVGELFRQYRRYGRGKAEVARLHPGSLRPRHLAPPALVAWLALAGVVGLRRPSLAAAAMAPYAAALLGAAGTAGTRDLEMPTRVRLPAAFAAMHIGWGVGLWEGLLAGRRDPVLDQVPG